MTEEHEEESRVVHCRKCLEEIPEGESPESYARLSLIISESGMAVWCMRHDTGVVLITPELLREMMQDLPPCPHCQDEQA